MEETISLKEIFEVLKKRILLIILLIIGAAGISAIISYFVLTPTYQSSSQFIVSQNASELENVDINQIRSNVEIINTYNQIITSPRILDGVIEELDLPMSAGALSGRISVASAQNSQVVTITATDTDPTMAVDIANTTVRVFQEEVPDLMNVNNVNILSEAQVSENPQPVNPKPLLNIAIAVVLGGMVGVGLAFLLEYMDNTIKTETDIENKLELPVIGVISHISDDEIATSRFNTTTNRRERGEFIGEKKKTS
ncbi:YveK family protein [Aquibacillus rhizosphaerae]|uniref:Wzz/FepE/Etk N-terminal domain-containing protein n=1 Tax=Aquibacillus rhizosphaerae TaxID=3051431 RepID=A0ABT7L2X8_9BACI|nr:Wzz/FepE/Etk N-terminal domain-containing protein [Aquibacillus sp. LR5S19]MDL4838945.1 Wzz/FepE/Etk N-terminal domain-containing protein [Aquibacillus sp. LR5S19]